MKIATLLLVLLLPCAAAYAEDCAKNSDACSAANKKLSPFLEASAAEQKPPAPASGPLKRTSLRQAEVRQPAIVPAPAEPAAPSAAPAASRNVSSPLWLLFVCGGVAGLYFYLRGGARRGRKK